MIPSITIDGIKTGIGIISLKRTADFLDKFAERTEDGVLHREPIGVYYNYKIKFGWNVDNEGEYDRLSYQLSDAKEYHTITMPNGVSGNRSFEGYCASVSDELFSTTGGQRWKGLSASFIASDPSRAYGSASPESVKIPIDRLISCKRKFDSLDRSAERSQNGALHRELIGVFHNYQFKFGWSVGHDEWYHSFYETITAPVDFHTVTLPDKQMGEVTQQAYFSSISDELFLAHDGNYYWKGLSANVIARKPLRLGSYLPE